MNRRQFLKAAAALAGGIFIADAIVEAHGLIVTRHDIASPTLPPELDGMRIAHLTDLHLPCAAADRAADVIAAEGPDLVLITGDTISQHEQLDLITPYIARVRGRFGTLAVRGNNEHWARLSVGTLSAAFAAGGATLLENAHAVVQYNGARLQVVGLDDPAVGRPDDRHRAAQRRRVLADGVADARARLHRSHHAQPADAAAGAAGARRPHARRADPRPRLHARRPARLGPLPRGLLRRAARPGLHQPRHRHQRRPAALPLPARAADLHAAPPGVIHERRGRPPRAHRARAHPLLPSAGCPDAFVFALAATVLVFVAGLAIGVPAGELVAAWGAGFPELLAFAMQMALVIVTGYVVATARPVRRAIDALARVPRSARGAVALVAAFAMATSWINWGFSLVFSAVLARAIARRFARRAASASTTARSAPRRCSASAASGRRASPARPRCRWRRPARCRRRSAPSSPNGGAIPGGVVGFAHTIFLWQSLVSVAVEIVVVTLLMWLAAPSESSARDAASLGISLADDATVAEPEPAARTPGERVEHSPILTLAVVALGAAYLVARLRRRRPDHRSPSTPSTSPCCSSACCCTGRRRA